MAIGAALAAAITAALALATAQAAAPSAVLTGRVLSGGLPQVGARVTLYRTAAPGAGRAVEVGASVTGAGGSFRIDYRAQQRSQVVLYLVAGRPTAPRLAAVLGTPPVRGPVVVDERTTVAAGFALAQFVTGVGVAGPAPGPQNAALMAADLVDVRSGSLGRVLLRRPNGNQTSTLREFNSLANSLVPCVRSARECPSLFRVARAPGAPLPRSTLVAMAEVARNPWHNVGALFKIARSGPAPYRPALGGGQKPDAWILALRFYGDGMTLDGPGNSAIDARGNVWVTNNYTYSRNPAANVCGSKLLFKFTPSGAYAPGSPYRGGGLNGQGYGITFDPRDHIWVGNFGFSSMRCNHPPPHNSVSEFTVNGKAISPRAGYTQGQVSWPQGVVSDRQGNIWTANCGNNSITRYAQGNPDRSRHLSYPGLFKPFDVAFNDRGQAFVTGNGSPYAVAVLNPDGSLARPLITPQGLNQPMGIAADTRGNMWIANSAAVAVPCPKGAIHSSGTPSVILIHANGVAAAAPFTGGGITMPWGIAVDGNNNVWVANFTGQHVSELCGVSHTDCRPGSGAGQPISPASGYGFDGLVRNTSVQVDPSGNLWITNNWKRYPLIFRNPGGYHMVVYIGVAGPLRTPLIGPPRPLAAPPG